LAFCQLEIDSKRFNDSYIGSAVAGFATRDPLQIGLAHATTAGVFNGIGLLSLGRLALKRLDRARLPSLPPESETNLNFNLGFAKYVIGRLHEAVPLFEAAFQAAQRCGDSTMIASARHFKRHCATYFVNAGVERDLGIQVLEAARRLRDRKFVFIGEFDLAEAYNRAGQLESGADRIYRALTHLGSERWYVTESIFSGVRGFFLLQCSRPELAHTILAEGWEITRLKKNFITRPLRSLPLLLESMVGQQWLQRARQEKELQVARRLERWCRRLHRSYPLLQSLMYRSQGRLAATQGRTGKAVRLFRRAVQSAERQGMPFYRAKALLDLAAVDPTDRESRRQRAIELLLEMQSVIPRAEGWLLGDQYDESVVAPGFALESWERQHGVISRPAREKPVEDYGTQIGLNR
jgi:tetratricopeptide (TPR) repeat protein